MFAKQQVIFTVNMEVTGLLDYMVVQPRWQWSLIKKRFELTQYKIFFF
jgi:hypothetical protein